MKNRTTPIMVIIFSSSMIPFIINNIPKNPRIPGIICENNSDPAINLTFSFYLF